MQSQAEPLCCDAGPPLLLLLWWQGGCLFLPCVCPILCMTHEASRYLQWPYDYAILWLFFLFLSFCHWLEK
ncbi:hypothetical protein F5X99DRAFT_379711 [Biscogniauxia marginata]|nr:hypothetical protein F5X99DRAFT_379711 [Biscogniauxia marginata]